MTALLLGVAITAIVVALIAGYYRLLESIYQERLTTDEVFLVTTRDLWKIRVCRYRKGRTSGQPVLLVHGANVNQHNFTSPRGSSLVDYLAERGFDCWTVDLRGCKSSVAPFERHRGQITTDDYLNDDIPTVIQFIQQETGYARVHYCGHSMGGMLLYAYALKHGSEAIASGVTLGSPVGFEGVKVSRSRFLLGLIRLSPSFFGGAARALAPCVALLRIRTPLFPMNMRNLAKGLGPEYFYTMLEDPLPGVLTDLANWVNNPGWTMDGGALDVQAGLKTLDFPLFALYAPGDPFVPVEEARAFFEGLATKDKRIQICGKEDGCKRDYGHCDLAFGLEGQREVFAPIARWFESHSSRDRMPVVEPEIATGYQTPLNAAQRAEILSGDSFAHLAEEEGVEGVEGGTAAGTATVEEVAALRTTSPQVPVTRKRPAIRKKSVAKGKQAAGRKTPGTQPAPRTAENTQVPNLASVSAAITALRPTGPRPPITDDTPITIKPEGQARRAGGANEPVETPRSVLQALSNASSALENFKRPSEDVADDREDDDRA